MKIKDREYLKEARELFYRVYEELPNYLDNITDDNITDDNITDFKKHKVFMDLKSAQYFLARYSYKLGIITNFELDFIKDEEDKYERTTKD